MCAHAWSDLSADKPETNWTNYYHIIKLYCLLDFRPSQLPPVWTDNLSRRTVSRKEMSYPLAEE